MRRGAWILCGVAAVLALTGFRAGSSAEPGGGTASAQALGIQVSVPGQGGASAGSVSAPPDAVGVGGSFAFPADGSVARASAVSSSVTASPGVSASASGSVSVSGVSLFGGEVTIGSVTVKADARAAGATASGGTSGSAVSGMTVGGQAVSTAPGSVVALGDWGTASILHQAAGSFGAATGRGYNASVTGVHIHVNVDHGNVPAGTDVVIGRVEVVADGAAPPPRQTKPAPRTASKPTRVSPAPRPKKKANRAAPIRPVPTDVIPRLTASGYVFPVYGPASFSDTFGAPRGGSVGWHHGEDIFAPLGAPVLAVANGIVYSVGWNDIGGLRLWLQDTAGNEFYYAHLSAFSPLAVNGASVRAGDVLGFVGNTGDAEATPYHLHFEIHPVSLLYLGYDGGAVPPYPYLMAWRRLTDVPLTGVAGWAPPLADSSRAPRPGAILLQARDISSASGLDPGSLRRAMRASRDASADGALPGTVPRGRAELRALARALGGR